MRLGGLEAQEGSYVNSASRFFTLSHQSHRIGFSLHFTVGLWRYDICATSIGIQYFSSLVPNFSVASETERRSSEARKPFNLFFGSCESRAARERERRRVE
jgi:hypothetical protein